MSPSGDIKQTKIPTLMELIFQWKKKQNNKNKQPKPANVLVYETVIYQRNGSESESEGEGSYCGFKQSTYSMAYSLFVSTPRTSAP